MGIKDLVTDFVDKFCEVKDGLTVSVNKKNYRQWIKALSLVLIQTINNFTEEQIGVLKN